MAVAAEVGLLFQKSLEEGEFIFLLAELFEL